MTRFSWLNIILFVWICTLNYSCGLKLWQPSKVTGISSGTSLHLSCIPIGLGPEERISKMKWVAPDGRYLKSNPDGRVSILSRSGRLALIIKRMKLSDAGNYTCVALGEDDGIVAELVVPVKVFESPEIMILPRKNLEIAYGSNLVLKCMALGLGPDGNAPKLMWVTPARYPVNNTFGRVSINRGHYTLTLYIQTIQASDVGRYTCRATGQQKALLTEAFVLVTVYRPITYTNCPPIQHLVANESGLIHCLADASPALHVSWKFKGAFIDDDGHYTEERKGLRINNVTDYDAGLYSCIAVAQHIGSFKSRDITVHVHSKLKQKAQQEQAVQDTMHELSKPLARYRDDKDLDQIMRERDRAGDSMLAIIKKRKRPEEDAKERPRYKGPAPPLARFGIQPGYRWDGVDRRNGFENQIFQKAADKKAKTTMAYK